MSKIKWEVSEQHSESIAYVEYKNGHLVRIEYVIDKKCWHISVLNGLSEHFSERPIQQAEAVKTLALKYLMETLGKIKMLVSK